MSWISELLQKLLAWAEDIGEKILDFATPIAKLIAKNGGDLLIDLALETITAMAATDLTNEEKRNTALNTLAEKCKAKGIEAGENLLRSVIELAVANLKAARE